MLDDIKKALGEIVDKGAIREAMEDRLLKGTEYEKRPESNIVHKDSEFEGDLPFAPLEDGVHGGGSWIEKHPAANPVDQLANEVLEDQIKGDLKNQKENRRSVYEAEAWGIETEVNVFSKTITYRWAFRPNFQSDHYEVVIYRSDNGNEDPLVCGKPPHRVAIGSERHYVDLGVTYFHKACLRVFTTGEEFDVIEFHSLIPLPESLDNVREQGKFFDGSQSVVVDLNQGKSKKLSKEEKISERIERSNYWIARKQKVRDQFKHREISEEEMVATMEILNKEEIYEKKRNGWL